jgi:hypothetical protein
MHRLCGMAHESRLLHDSDAADADMSLCIKGEGHLCNGPLDGQPHSPLQAALLLFNALWHAGLDAREHGKGAQQRPDAYVWCLPRRHWCCQSPSCLRRQPRRQSPHAPGEACTERWTKPPELTSPRSFSQNQHKSMSWLVGNQVLINTDTCFRYAGLHASLECHCAQLTMP